MIGRLALPALLLCVISSPLAHAAERGQARATLADKAVVIDYGRPNLGGRDMLAQAEIGKAWRMGADAATTLKTEAELRFGDVVVPRGDYVLRATRVAPDLWQLNVAKSDGTAVGAVPLTTHKLDDSVETFTIELAASGAGGEFVMKWGGTALKTRFTGR